jgi:hypothetical protein
LRLGLADAQFLHDVLRDEVALVDVDLVARPTSAPTRPARDNDEQGDEAETDRTRIAVKEATNRRIIPARIGPDGNGMTTLHDLKTTGSRPPRRAEDPEPVRAQHGSASSAEDVYRLLLNEASTSAWRPSTACSRSSNRRDC